MGRILLGAVMLVVLTLAYQSNAHVLLCEQRPDYYVECPHFHAGGGGTSNNKSEPPTKEPPTKEPPGTGPPVEPSRDHHQPPGRGLGHDNHDWDHKGKGHSKGAKGHGDE